MIQFNMFTMALAFIVGVTLMLSLFNLILYIHMRTQMHNLAAAYHESIRQVLHHVSKLFQLGGENAAGNVFLCPKCSRITSDPAHIHDRYCPTCKERFPEAG